MKLHEVPSLLNSPTLSVAGLKEVSVTPYVTGAVGSAWGVVPHAANPSECVAVITAPAELEQLLFTGTVLSSLITIELGTPGVRVLLIRSFRADNETRPLGVTGQEQQATISSAGSNT